MVQFIAGFFIGGFTALLIYAFILVAYEEEEGGHHKRTRK